MAGVWVDWMFDINGMSLIALFYLTCPWNQIPCLERYHKDIVKHNHTYVKVKNNNVISNYYWWVFSKYYSFLKACTSKVVFFSLVYLLVPEFILEDRVKTQAIQLMYKRLNIFNGFFSIDFK